MMETLIEKLSRLPIVQALEADDEKKKVAARKKHVQELEAVLKRRESDVKPFIKAVRAAEEGLKAAKAALEEGQAAHQEASYRKASYLAQQNREQQLHEKFLKETAPALVDQFYDKIVAEWERARQVQAVSETAGLNANGQPILVRSNEESIKARLAAFVKVRNQTESLKLLATRGQIEAAINELWASIPRVQVPEPFTAAELKEIEDHPGPPPAPSRRSDQRPRWPLTPEELEAEEAVP